MLAELGRVVRPGGALVLEFANKRNLKAIARQLLGRQTLVAVRARRRGVQATSTSTTPR